MNEHDRIRQIIGGQRPYAAHWEWLPGAEGRPIKEGGVLADFLEARTRLGFPPYRNPRRAEQDPPDFIVENEAGEPVAIELTELVSREAIEANVRDRGNPVYRDWSPPDVFKAITEGLQSKDGKTYHGGPYKDIIVVLYTAEPVMQPAKYVPLLGAHAFPALKQVTRAYCLFSYDPETESYPFVELKLGAVPRPMQGPSVSGEATAT